MRVPTSPASRFEHGPEQALLSAAEASRARSGLGELVSVIGRRELLAWLSCLVRSGPVIRRPRSVADEGLQVVPDMETTTEADRVQGECNPAPFVSGLRE